MIINDPQDPYSSVVVEASAGSGKTYQLSRRFLYLVGAGAPAQSILTITFTVKAAQEMRNRIISEATKLLHQPELQAAFDAELRSFYRRARAGAKDDAFKLRPPRSGAATASEILSATQSLKISTIDAIFNEWLSRFVWEAGTDSAGQTYVPYPYRIADRLEQNEIEDEVWKKLFTQLTKNEGRVFVENLIASSDRGALTINAQLRELDRFHTYVWQLENHSQTGAFRALKTPVPEETPASEDDLFALLSRDLLTIAGETKRFAIYAEAIHQRNLGDLITSKLLTQAGKVSGIIIKGAKRERLASEIAFVEETIGHYYALNQLNQLNCTGANLWTSYKWWSQLYQREAYRAGKCTFTDLSKSCFRLFNSDAGIGAVWLIQKGIHHLLIDEFQDTSLLQWSIFCKLKEELLSGDGASSSHGLASTAFMVGDRKQSIYGFREADPEVMDLARHTFEHFDAKILALNHSFRTTQVILNVINRFFQENIDEKFPCHQTALLNNQPAIPNQGSFTIVETFLPSNDDDNGEEPTALEKELAFVSEYLQQALAEPRSFPVYDRHLGGFRPLRASDCCVLYRNSTHADVFEQALRERDILTRREERKGFFSRPEIRDLMALLRYLAYPDDELALYSFARSPFAGISDSAIFATLDHIYLERNANEVERQQVLRPIIANHFPAFNAALQSLLNRVDSFATFELVAMAMEVFSITNVIDTHFPAHEREFARNNVLYLIEQATASDVTHGVGLAAFVSRLEQKAELDEMGSSASGSDAVTMMTIHKAKGLEYPFVMIIEAAEPWFKSDRYWLKGNLDHPGVSYIGRRDQQPKRFLAFSQELERQQQQLIAESARLLYVALTRASQYVTVSGHKSPKKPVGVFYSGLLEAVRASGAQEHDGVLSLRAQTAVNWVDDQVDDHEPLRAYSSPIIVRQSSPDLTIVSPHLEVNDERQKSKVTTSQTLSPEVSAMIGSYIHKALECLVSEQTWDADYWWKQLVEDKRASNLIVAFSNPSPVIAENLQEIADREIKATMTSDEFRQFLSSAEQVKTEVELVLRQKTVLMRGVCDLIVIHNSQSVTIVDYKTAALTSEECRQKRYFNQLGWYRRAWQAMHPGCQVHSAIWLTKSQEFVHL